MKKRLLKRAKNPRFNDRKASCIKLIQLALRSLNPGDFRAASKAAFSCSLGITDFVQAAKGVECKEFLATGHIFGASCFMKETAVANPVSENQSLPSALYLRTKVLMVFFDMFSLLAVGLIPSSNASSIMLLRTEKRFALLSFAIKLQQFPLKIDSSC